MSTGGDVGRSMGFIRFRGRCGGSRWCHGHILNGPCDFHLMTYLSFQIWRWLQPSRAARPNPSYDPPGLHRSGTLKRHPEGRVPYLPTSTLPSRRRSRIRGQNPRLGESWPLSGHPLASWVTGYPEVIPPLIRQDEREGFWFHLASFSTQNKLPFYRSGH